MKLETLTDHAYDLFKSHRYKELVSVLSEDILVEHRSIILNGLKSAAKAILALRQEVIPEALERFESIDHGLENVGVIEDVTFINDSRATNVYSTWFALEATAPPIVLILGGTDNGNEYSEIIELVLTKVQSIVCIGVDNSKLLAAFGGVVGQIVEALSMDEAVDFSFVLSKPGDTVLLSPACASFDRFQNYEDRGEQFKASFQRLKNNLKDVFLLDCSLYLSSDDKNKAQSIFESFKKVVNTFGFILYSEEPPVIGSWFKRFRLRVIHSLESKHTQDRLRQLEYALNLHGIKRTQSETDANYINSISHLMEATKDEQEIVLHVGALVYIRSRNAENKSMVFVKILATDQLVLIERNPELVANPSTLLKLLSGSCGESNE